MAAALTVVGGVASTVQIIDVLARTAAGVQSLRAQWQSSELLLLSLTSQLGLLKASLLKIEEWRGSREETVYQVAAELNTAIDCCRSLADRLFHTIAELQSAPCSSVPGATEIRFLLKKSDLDELHGRLGHQIQALDLFLTACNSESLLRQQQIMETYDIRKHVNRVKKDTESMHGSADSSSSASKVTMTSAFSSPLEENNRLHRSATPENTYKDSRDLSVQSIREIPKGVEEVVTTESTNVVASQPPTVRSTSSYYQQKPQIAKTVSNVVFLGQAESSKSTFVQQLQWMYALGFSTEEIKQWRTNIHEHIADTLEGILHVLQGDNSTDSDSYRQIHSRIRSVQNFVQSSRAEPCPTGSVDVFKWLIKDILQLNVAAAVSHCLSNNIEYFAEHFDRVCSSTYLPTHEDIFRARSRPVGICKHLFTLPHNKVHVYDVSGERAERSASTAIADQVSTVLIFVPMDCYDQVLYEDRSMNRMQEALNLVGSIVNEQPQWKHCNMVLCFTKCDIFELKIKAGMTPLGDFFRDYKGSPTDVLACREYIMEQFADISRHSGHVDAFYIDATNSEHVRKVMEAVLEKGCPTRLS